MLFAFDQTAFLQQDEHRPHGGGIGCHSLGQFSLGERMPAGEGCQKDELIRRDPQFGKLQIRSAMQCQVRGTKGNRYVASGRHRQDIPIMCVHARFRQIVRRQMSER